MRWGMQLAARRSPLLCVPSSTICRKIHFAPGVRNTPLTSDQSKLVRLDASRDRAGPPSRGIERSRERRALSFSCSWSVYRRPTFFWLRSRGMPIFSQCRCFDSSPGSRFEHWRDHGHPRASAVALTPSELDSSADSSEPGVDLEAFDRSLETLRQFRLTSIRRGVRTVVWHVARPGTASPLRPSASPGRPVPCVGRHRRSQSGTLLPRGGA